MSSVNKAFIIGRATRDAEVRSLGNGKEVASLTIATSERWKSKDGEQKEASEFHKVSIFNEHLVRVAKDFVKKGTQVCIEGQLKTRKYQDKEGRDCYTTEIVLQGFSGNLTLLGGGDKLSPTSHDEAKHDGYAPQADPFDDGLGF
jgi:single-strand DNA-binding protein